VLFFIPYAVDVPMDRRPVLNWLLVGSIIAAFVCQFYVAHEETVNAYVLDGWTLNGLFGHMWLHGGFLHVAGNLLFLWVFGNAVCSKVNNLLYLPVYIFVGIMAALTHMIIDGDPAIGASGAINGIVGMYLVFFPTNDIDCAFGGVIMMRPFGKTFSVSGYWIILMYLVFDIIGVILGGQGVGYWAHLGGFAAGVVLALLLLKLKMVTMWDDEGSILQLIDEWRTGRQDDQLRKEAMAAVEKAQQQEQGHPVPIPTESVQPKRFSFACPCGKKIRAPITMAGKKGKCPACQSLLIVPSSHG
jgi:membrane associated rhomboid family serine protease